MLGKMIQEKLEELHIKGWTDAAMAQAIGTSRVSVSRWRHGLMQPTVMCEAIYQSCEMLLRMDAPPRVHRGGRPRKAPPGAPDQVAV